MSPVEIPHLKEEAGPSQGGKETFQVTSGQRLTIQFLTWPSLFIRHSTVFGKHSPDCAASVIWSGASVIWNGSGRTKRRMCPAHVCVHIHVEARGPPQVWLLKYHPTFLMKLCLIGVEVDNSTRLAGQQGRSAYVHLLRVGIEYKSMAPHLACYLDSKEQTLVLITVW